MPKTLVFLLLCFQMLIANEASKASISIHFSGNKVFTSAELREYTNIFDDFNQFEVNKQDFLMQEVIRMNLIDLYHSKGYFGVEIQLDIQKEFISLEQEERSYFFSIQENQIYTLDSVAIFIQNKHADLLTDYDQLKSNKNQNYNEALISNDIEYIRKKFYKQGFLHAVIQSSRQIDHSNRRVILNVFIEPNTKVIMGDIKSKAFQPLSIKNNDLTQKKGLSETKVLNGLWKTPKGESIDGNQFHSFKTKLYSTQLFTQVKLEDSLRTDGLSDIHLQVIERVPGEVVYSIFFEEEYGFGGSAKIKHKNPFGSFHELSAGMFVAEKKQELSLGYAHPLVFGTQIHFIPTAIRFDYNISFNHEESTPPAYPDSVEEQTELINRANISFGLTSKINFRSLLDFRYQNKNSKNALKFKNEYSLHFNFTDDFFNPQKGVYLKPTLGIGKNLIQSKFEDTYYYGELTTNLYFPIRFIHSLYGAISLSGGAFINEALEDDARSFYQGGSRSVRGYRFRSIYASYETQEDTLSIIHTGLTPRYWRINQELRYNLPLKNYKKWQIVQFYDLSQVSDKNKKYQESLAASLGLGLRYHWQFLTIRLDYALKKDFSDASLLEPYHFDRVHLDLSQAF